MAVNYTPTRGDYKDLTPFRFWCQKVLPMVYDDSLSYYELLCKVVDYLNKTMEDVGTLEGDVTSIYSAYESLQGYVNDYFDNLDVQDEIDDKLDRLVADGTIYEIFSDDVTAILQQGADTRAEVIAQGVEARNTAIANVPSVVTNWLATNIEQETGYVIDASLSVAGAAADAKATGDAVDGVKSTVETIQTIGDGFNLLTGVVWEVGSISTIDGADQIVSNRIRTKNYIDISVCTAITFSIASGFKYVYDLYDANHTLVTEQQSGVWQTTTKTLTFSPSVRYVRLLVSDTSDSTADVSFSENLTASYVTEWNAFNNAIKDKINLLDSIATLSPDLVLTDWVNKSISGDNGVAFGSSTRICSAEYVDISAYSSITMSPTSGYKAYIYYYDNNYTYLNGKQAGWFDTETTVAVPSDAVYALILIAKSNDTAINPSEYVNVSFSYSTAIIDAVEGKRTDIISLNPGFSASVLQARRPINLRGNGYTSELKPLSLLWFSDIHGNTVNLQRIMDFRDKYSTYFDDTVCSGDLVPYRSADGMSFWDSVSGAENILICIGNHDALADPSGFDWTQITTQAEQYAAYIAPYYANWDLSSPVSSGLTYWYKDYSDSGIRLICLNCMLSGADDSAQQTWFQSALSGAKTAGYTVVIMTHCPIAGATVIPSNWTNKDRNSINDYLNTAYKGYVDTFKGDGGKFACWITGHMHWDFLSKYTGTNGDQLVLTIDAANVSQSNYYSDMQRTIGTKSQDLANAVFIDTSSQCVKVIRIGANEDHYLRPRNVLSISYDGNIIAQE